MVNILTHRERMNRECVTHCPEREFGRDGDVMKCPHGYWFVFRLITSYGRGGWYHATPKEMRRIKKALKRGEQP